MQAELQQFIGNIFWEKGEHLLNHRCASDHLSRRIVISAAKSGISSPVSGKISKNLREEHMIHLRGALFIYLYREVVKSKLPYQDRMRLWPKNQTTLF